MRLIILSMFLSFIFSSAYGISTNDCNTLIEKFKNDCINELEERCSTLAACQANQKKCNIDANSKDGCRRVNDCHDESKCKYEWIRFNGAYQCKIAGGHIQGTKFLGENCPGYTSTMAYLSKDTIKNSYINCGGQKKYYRNRLEYCKSSAKYFVAYKKQCNIDQRLLDATIKIQNAIPFSDESICKNNMIIITPADEIKGGNQKREQSKNIIQKIIDKTKDKFFNK